MLYAVKLTNKIISVLISDARSFLEDSSSLVHWVNGTQTQTCTGENTMCDISFRKVPDVIDTDSYRPVVSFL